MIASYSEYLKKKALLDSGGDFSDEAVAKVQSALDEYKTKYLGSGTDLPLSPDAGASAINQSAKLPSQEDVSHQLEHAPTAAVPREADLVSQLDPGFALPPQALATLPATTHPDGDEAAKDEWIRGDLNNPKGVVVVYDAPMAAIRQDLAKNPMMLDFAGHGYGGQDAGTRIASIQKGDSVEQAYNDYKWRQTADAAAKAGKTAYRYTKAPYLTDGKSASLLDNLSTKIGFNTGAADTARAFILGVDDLGSFGVVNAAAKAGADKRSDTTLAGTPMPPAKYDFSALAPKSKSRFETVNNPDDMSAADRNSAVKEDHPLAYTAGQVTAAAPGLAEAGVKGAGKVVGALSEPAGKAVGAFGEGIAGLSDWLPSNRLWNYITGSPGESVASKVVGGAAKNALAGGVSEGLTTGAEAASNYAKSGDPGMTAEQARMRVAHSAEVGGVLGSLGGIAHAASGGIGNWVREGDHYRQLPGKVEALGSEPQFIKGFSTPPVVEAARAEARARPGRPEPIDMIAEKTKKPLADAVKAEEGSQRSIVHQENEEVFNSPEGHRPLPAAELAKESVNKLRALTSPRRGSRAPQAVGLPNADRPMRGVFNMNVDGVSVHPVEGAIALSPEEAQAFLHPALQDRALEAARTRKVAKVTDSDLAIVAHDHEADLPGVTEALAPVPKGETGVTAPGASLAKVPRYPGARRPELPPAGDIQRAAPDAMTQGAREPTAGERAGSHTATARQVATATEVQGSRWKRTGAPEPTAERGKRTRTQPEGDTAQELRRAGVKTVYVLPRQYDARRQETVVHLLRTGGGDSNRARVLEDLYHASLRDRDARPWQGQPGGWSALQRQHQQRLATAKDMRARVAPEGSAYQSTITHGNHVAGKSEDIDAMQRAAELAGGKNPELVRGARVLRSLTDLQGLSNFGRSTSGGESRLPWGPSAITDATMLRGIYPATRAIERSATGGAQTLSRLSLGGMHQLREQDQRKKDTPRPTPSASSAEKTPQRRRYSRHARSNPSGSE